MERQLKYGALLAVIALIGLIALGCSSGPFSRSAAGIEPSRIMPAVIIPIDENGNVRDSDGPWVFLFDLGDERVRAANVDLESTAQQIATFMRENPHLRLRIDDGAPPASMDAKTLAVRQHRITTIRAALVKAGVPDIRISEGVASSRVRLFR